MKRISATISDDLWALLRQECEQRGVPVAVVVREALAAHLEQRWSRNFSFVGIGRSGKHDISSRLDEILAEEWGNHLRRSSGLSED